MKKILWGLFALSLLAAPVSAQQLVVQTQPLPRLTTNASSTIAVTDTFQTVWAQQNGPVGSVAIRNNCSIQNNGNNTMWVFAGSGTATKATSVVLPSGGLFKCGDGGTVATSAISITGTATDAFFAALDGSPSVEVGGGVRGNADGLFSLNGATSAAAVAPSSSITTAVSGGVVAKASAGNFYGANLTTGGSAGFFLLFDSTSVPADGAVTPARCYTVAANATLAVSANPPIRLATGITMVFSTTGCFNKTISATAFMAVDYK